MNLWHFFAMYFDNDNLVTIIYFKDQVYTGITETVPFSFLSIQYLQQYTNILTIMCHQQGLHYYELKVDFIHIFSQCNDRQINDIIIQYHPEILHYIIPTCKLEASRIYIWLKDHTIQSFFTLNLRVIKLFITDNIFSIIKRGQSFTLITWNWDSTTQITENNDILSDYELQQWYLLESDHSSYFKIRTVQQEYIIEFNIFKIFVEAQLELKIDNLVFSQLIITQKKIELLCPPNCQECVKFTCIKCKGNRVGQNCTCPSYQQDFGLELCEFSYMKLPIQIIRNDEPCPLGYLQCFSNILCDHNYIKYQETCIKWQFFYYLSPMLGTEVCRACLTNIEIKENQLLCKYTNERNLLRFKKYQIEDYMEFKQSGSFYIQDQYFNKVNLTSVTIFYQIINSTFQPIIRKKNQHAEILCPFNYQSVYIMAFKNNLQLFCLKLPKQCLYLKLNNLIYQCVYCKEGYSLIDHSCMKCPQQCQSCNILRCTSCFSGYYVSIDGSCRLCDIPNCQICYEYDNGLISVNDHFMYKKFKTLCALCQQDFQFNFNTYQCEQQQQSNTCQIAVFNNREICLVDQNQNINILSTSCSSKECIQCYKNKCLSCQSGYYLDKLSCKICPSLKYISLEQASMISCYLTDLVNYQHQKQSIQHILLYHKEAFIDQSQLLVQVDRCLGNQILYDISDCQPINNEFTDNQLNYCEKYILTTTSKPYCIKIKQQLTNLIINRSTGLVTPCRGYKSCLLIANYILERQQDLEGCFHNGIYFDSIQNFFDALNYAFLLQEQIDEINIIYTSKAYYLVIDIQRTRIPINLIITNKYEKSFEDFESISISNMNNILIDDILGSIGNQIQCYNLVINLFYSIENNGCNFQQCIQLFINSTILNIKDISIQHYYDRLIAFNYVSQKNIDIEYIQINHDCLNSVYFLFAKNNDQLNVNIQTLLIYDSNLTNCSLLQLEKHQSITIFNLTIKHSIISSTFFISCFSLNIQHMLITESFFYNSTLFYTLKVMNVTNKLQVINSEFNNTNIIISRSYTEINQIQIIHCSFIDTQIIFSDGIVMVIKQIKFLELIALNVILEQALILSRADTTKINEFYHYLQEGNSTTLLIYSKYVYLNQFYLKYQMNPYNLGQLDDECQINIIKKEYHTFLFIKDYTYLMFTNSTFLNIYTIKPILRLVSIVRSSVELTNLTFQNIQSFSIVLIELQASNCSLYSILFIDIWTHSILHSNQQLTYQVLYILSINIFLENSQFIRIKNINIINFILINLQSDIVNLKQLIFISQPAPISQFVSHNSDNKRHIDYLDNSSGEFSLMLLNAINITINSLQVTNFTNTLNYLIQVTSSQPIQLLNVRSVLLQYQNFFCKGLIQVNTITKDASISNIQIGSIHVINFIFDIKISNSINFTNSRIRLIHNGGIINCSLQSKSAKLIFNNLTLHKLSILKRQYFSIQQRVLINILNGQIFLKDIFVNRIVGDLLSIRDAVNVTLLHVLITNGQFIENLIQIKSLYGLNVRISGLVIKGYRIIKQLSYSSFQQQETHQQCWSGNVSFQQNTKELFTIKPIALLYIFVGKSPDQKLSFDNIRILNNQNQSALMKLENFYSVTILNLSLGSNICDEICFIIYNHPNDQQVNSLLQKQNTIKFVNSQLVKNQGILFDQDTSSISFYKSILFHEHLILKENTQISQIILYDSYLINTNFQINQLKLVYNYDSHLTQQFNQLYLVLSFDNGSTYYPTVNKSVIFNNKQNKLFKYSNFPTGQSLGEYQRLNFQQLQYEQFIREMKLIPRGHGSEIDQSCNLFYFNTSVKFSLAQQDWKQFKIIQNPKNKSLIQMNVICESVSLKFSLKILNCQLGEIQVNNECLRCPQNQFSLKPNSVKCSYINDLIDETQSGLIKVKQGYWRPYFTNDQISECLRQENCQGGWSIGNQMCKKGHIGALCQECDLYSIRGDGKYSKKQPNECVLCYRSYSAYIQLGFIIILHFIVLYSAQISWNANNVRIQNLRLFKSKFFMRLYQFELDQYQNLAEISNNWIQIFLIIEQSCDVIPNILRNILNFHSNPSLNIQSLFQCLISDYLTLNEVTYSVSIISIVLYIILIQISLLIYCIQIIISKSKYQVKLVLLVVNQVLFDHYINVAENLIKQSTWVSISGIKWINAHKSLEYMTHTHLFNLCIMILPQAIILFMVIPIVYYHIVNREPKLLFKTSFFNKWGYCYQNYKSGYQHWFLVIIQIKIVVVIIMNIFDNANLKILLFTFICFSKSHQSCKPYLIRKFNKYNHQLLNQLSILVAQFYLLNYCQTNVKQLVFCIQVTIIYSLIKSCSVIFKNAQPILTQQIPEFLNKYAKSNITKYFCVDKYLQKLIKNHSDRSTHIQNILQRFKAKTKAQICLKYSSKQTQQSIFNCDCLESPNTNIHSFPFKISYQEEVRITQDSIK